VRASHQRPTCNILGPTALGFRHRDDVHEIRNLLEELGVDVRVVAPLGATAADLARLHEADFNVVLYPETGMTAALWLQRQYQQPFTRVVPIGVNATQEFVEEVAELAGMDAVPDLRQNSRAGWYSRSVDSTYLTGKRVFIFGDASHVVAAARVATQEMGFTVVGLGTYSREYAREVRDAAKRYGCEALITDDYLEVEERISQLQPELVLGTQMERHISKRLGLPCAVISAPIHVQDFPARYSPQMGFEGANVLFDTWVHPLMMGLEEHLIGMFRGDAEFHEDAAPSHLGRAGAPARMAVSSQATPATPETAVAAPAPPPQKTSEPDAVDTSTPVLQAAWGVDAEKELKKIPFFVRGKAKRNTELYAREQGLPIITVETLYDAKAYFSR
jgi:light-independent protochlorophyllide reductase subunit B